MPIREESIDVAAEVLAAAREKHPDHAFIVIAAIKYNDPDTGRPMMDQAITSNVNSQERVLQFLLDFVRRSITGHLKKIVK